MNVLCDSYVSQHFSTTKWVLSVLRKVGRLRIIHGSNANSELSANSSEVKVLEVGAINTEMIEAAKRSKSDYRKTDISVRSIDIQSQHPDIEELDFFDLEKTESTKYDVIVCSMVLNCVPTPDQRGQMLIKLRHHLVEDGLLFLTVPCTCLKLSKYMDKQRFVELIKSLGYSLVEEKETPKVAFFVLKRNIVEDEVKHKFSKLVEIRRGSKYRNLFGVVVKC